MENTTTWHKEAEEMLEIILRNEDACLPRDLHLTDEEKARIIQETVQGFCDAWNQLYEDMSDYLYALADNPPDEHEVKP